MKEDENKIVLEVVFSVIIDMYGFVIAKVNSKYKYIKVSSIVESPTGIKVGTCKLVIDNKEAIIILYVEREDNIPYDFCLSIDGCKIKAVYH